MDSAKKNFGFWIPSAKPKKNANVASHIRQSTEIGIDFVVASGEKKEQQGK